KVHVRSPASRKMLGQTPHQHLANTGIFCLRVDRETPERRALLGIGKGTRMIDTGYGTDDFARIFVLSDQIGERAAVAVAPEEVGPYLHHAARAIDAVHRACIGLRRQPADEEAARLAAA